MHLFWSNLKIKGKGWVGRDAEKIKFDKVDSERYIVKAAE